MAAQIEITNLDSFLASVRAAQKVVSDLSVPLRQIGLDWMTSNRTIFSLTTAGPWADLSGGRTGRDSKGRFRSPNSGYKAQKLKKWGFIYPILKASGRLESSITVPGDPGSLFEVINGVTLVLGTRVTGKGGANYPYFLQAGTRFMPPRPFLTIPQLSIAGWVRTLERYVASQVQALPAATQIGA